MSKFQMASFVDSEKQIFAILIALASIDAQNINTPPALILMSQTAYEKFEADYPDFNLKNKIKKLGGILKLSFPKGYNWNLGFRPALNHLAQSIKSDHAMLYFAPNTVFFDNAFVIKCKDQTWAARTPDDFWPERELYGPSLTSMWDTIIKMGTDISGEDSKRWIDENFPEEYWRRYPAASPALFYATKPEDFAEKYAKINNDYIENQPKVLDGQGHAPMEAILPATLIASNGELINPEWDIDLAHYHDFYDLILRMSDRHAEWFEEKILQNPVLRGLLKSDLELKIIFYQNRVSKVRQKLDGIERRFSIKRMQQLISRRNIRRGVRKKVKEEKSAANAA